MPLLSMEHTAELLALAHAHHQCGACGHCTAMEYCRTCDEFFWIHGAGCPMHEDQHHGHRLVLTPFVEERK